MPDINNLITAVTAGMSRAEPAPDVSLALLIQARPSIEELDALRHFFREWGQFGTPAPDGLDTDATIWVMENSLRQAERVEQFESLIDRAAAVLSDRRYIRLTTG